MTNPGSAGFLLLLVHFLLFMMRCPHSLSAEWAALLKSMRMLNSGLQKQADGDLQCVCFLCSDTSRWVLFLVLSFWSSGQEPVAAKQVLASETEQLSNFILSDCTKEALANKKMLPL